MGHPVKLHVYDLSGGMARTMSRQLTGIQIDGIWHSSVIAFGKEIYYGQGVYSCAPGTSHLGQPLHIYDMGETEIDEATYDEYVGELKGHYTAEKYHLLEFNCNSFTNDVVGFLTGGTIPDHIKDLPTQFLSTPFGQQMRPMIDSMYRRGPPPSTIRSSPAQAYPTPAQTPPPGLANTTGALSESVAPSLLQSVAAQAASAPGREPSVSSLGSHLFVSTNPASFESILKRHRGVTALFVGNSPAERELEVAFETLAKRKARSNQVAFVRVDVKVGNAKEVLEMWGPEKTPSVVHFLKGEKMSEWSLPSCDEFETSVDGFLKTAFPPHPHSSLELPTMRALSLSPILFTQVPVSLDVPVMRLTSIIDAKSNPPAAIIRAKTILTTSFAPFLKHRFLPGSSPTSKENTSIPVTPKQLKEWTEMTTALVGVIPPVGLFPLIDLWRLAILDNRLASTTAPATLQKKITEFVEKSINSGSISDVPKPVLLTTLRLTANMFAFANSSPLGDGLPVLVASLLHPDASVRSAAASVAFNVAATRHAGVRGPDVYWEELARREEDGSGADDVELACVLLEAVEREKESEDVVHRLVASLGLLVYLSPSCSLDNNELGDTLEVLGAKEKILSKLEPSGGVSQEGLRKLVEEVGGTLCR